MRDSELLEKLLNEDAYSYVCENGELCSMGYCVAYTLQLPMYYFCAYADNPIHYTVVHFGELEDTYSRVTVYFSNGAIAEWENNVINGYNIQFPVSVSRDGERVFIQTWESGLHCLSAKTGEKLWRTKSREGITTIYVNDSTVCAMAHDKAFRLLDVETGELIKERKPARAWKFHPVDSTHIMCQTTARIWEVIDTVTLESVEEIPAKDKKAVEERLCYFYRNMEEKSSNGDE